VHALDLLHPSGKRPCYRRTCDKRIKSLGTHAKANTLAHRWSALLCGTAKWEGRCLMLGSDVIVTSGSLAIGRVLHAAPRTVPIVFV
jgi:hypothetical protein